MGKNKRKQWNLLIIGAGAAGMMAAITAARAGKSVCILEKSDKVGKKLLATGNGKCNFTNANMFTEAFHGEKAFVEQVLDTFSVKDCLDFFYSIGIYPKNKNGYYYPNSEQAASVVKALEQELARMHVKIMLETAVLSIHPEEQGVVVQTNKGSFAGDDLILASGLLASPKLGSDGSMFDAIKALGHRFVPVLPALCGFFCKGIPFKQVSGVRVQGTVKAYVDNKLLAEDTGEIQFTDYGLSGIPVFQISHFLSKGLYEKRDVRIQLVLLPDFEQKQLLEELHYRKVHFTESTMEHLLNGLLPQKLADMLLQKLHMDKEQYISSLTEKEIQSLAYEMQNLKVSVTKCRDYEFAQVCTGGIPLKDVEWTTLESQFVKHIYFAGEILDVDAICGGYNLHFAWATGQRAANAIVEKGKYDSNNTIKASLST